MKILVTGSNGLLGQKLIQLLSKKDNVELLATSKGENRFKNKEGYQYQSLDITNRTEVLDVVDSFKHGASSISSPIRSTYTPNPNFVGKDRLVFTVTDDNDAVSEEKTIFITVK